MHAPDTLTKANLSARGDFGKSTIVLLFIALIAIAAIPIVTHALPPLSDYVNHLGRTYVINNIGSDPNLARFYSAKWQVLPNLMIDIAMLVLNPFMDIYRAGQIFTIAAFVLILSGTLAINRALFGSWSALPLVAAPLLYNGVLLVGVMNYIFGVGLALWAFAAWVALRERPWPWRFTASTLFAVALFFCHLYAVGLYGLVMLGFELNRLWIKRAEPLGPRLIALVAAGIPFLPVVVLLALSPTWSSVNSFSWTIEGKIEGLTLAVSVYYNSVAFVLVGVVLAGAAWATWRGLLRFHRAGWFVLGLSAIVYMAMPRSLFAAYMADQRLPIALAFVLVACFHVEFRHRRMRGAFAAALVVLLAMRVVEVQVVWDRLDLVTQAFHRSVALIERGARVLVVHGDRSTGEDVSDFEILHAASIATIERSALVSTTFTVQGKQVLQVRDEFRRYVETEDRTPPSIPYFLQAAHNDVPYFFTRWPKHFDYVYILFTKRGAKNPDPEDMKQIFDGPIFQLYRVTNPR